MKDLWQQRLSLNERAVEACMLPCSTESIKLKELLANYYGCKVMNYFNKGTSKTSIFVSERLFGQKYSSFEACFISL